MAVSLLPGRLRSFTDGGLQAPVAHVQRPEVLLLRLWQPTDERLGWSDCVPGLSNPLQ